MLVSLSMNVDGFTYNDWYTMPVYQRTVYVKFVEEVAEEQRKRIEKR